MRVPRHIALTMLAILLACAAVTLPWGLATGSALPFGILALVAMITCGWVMVRASKHPED